MNIVSLAVAAAFTSIVCCAGSANAQAAVYVKKCAWIDNGRGCLDGGISVYACDRDGYGGYDGSIYAAFPSGASCIFDVGAVESLPPEAITMDPLMSSATVDFCVPSREYPGNQLCANIRVGASYPPSVLFGSRPPDDLITIYADRSGHAESGEVVSVLGSLPVTGVEADMFETIGIRSAQ